MQDGPLTLQGADAVRKLDELQLVRDEWQKRDANVDRQC
jgi:hypothetical protein